MKLSYKLAIKSTLLLMVAIMIILIFVGMKLRSHGIEEVELRARLLLQSKQAMIDFVTKELRPNLYRYLSENNINNPEFELTWMSAGFVTRRVLHYFSQNDFAEYYFKDAAINARSPENEANAYEAAYLNELAEGARETSRSIIMNINGKPFFIYMQPHTGMFTKDCMLCHSTPENAPPGLVEKYGSERSFGKEIGALPSILSIRIPMTQAQIYNEKLIMGISAFIVFFLSCVFLVQWFFTRREIVSPLKKIIRTAQMIAEDESRLGEMIKVRGGTELTELADAFSLMSRKLSDSRDNLERQVQERTEEFRQSEQRYKLLFDKMLNGFALHEMIYDESGNPVDYRFLAVNAEFERQTGLSASDVEGKRVREVMPNVEPFWIIVYGKVVETGMPVQFESYSRELDKFYEVKAFSAGPSQFAAIFMDITERVAIEEKTNELEEQLQQSQKMEAIGTLAGGIAHDFNNILAAILGYAELIEDEIPASSPAGDDIKEIISSVLMAKKLVSRILEFSRQSKQKRTPLDMQMLVKDTMRFMRSTIPSTIHIHDEINPACGKIFADSKQLQQVLISLTTNATHAMRKGGGNLNVHLDCCEIKMEDVQSFPGLKPGKYLKLEVSDTGTGIAPDDLGRIFDPYFTTKEVGEGSGMGLAVVHGIVKANDGEITVKSEPGKGTTFCVYFPVYEEV